MVLVMNPVINECVDLAKKLPLSSATESRSNRYKDARNTGEGRWASNSGLATRDRGTKELKVGDSPIRSLIRLAARSRNFSCALRYFLASQLNHPTRFLKLDPYIFTGILLEPLLLSLIF